MIIEVVICDGCGEELRVDPDDTPKTTMDDVGWLVNPENGFEHFCDSCS